MKSHLGLAEGWGRRWKSKDLKQRGLCFQGSKHRGVLCLETTLGLTEAGGEING